MTNTWDNDFEVWRKSYLIGMSEDKEFRELTKVWLQKTVDHKQSYQFDWLGVPVIQTPGDLLVFQDIIWRTKPDLIIETGVARGGSLIFWASMQNLCRIDGLVVGVDIEIRDHAKKAIEASRYNSTIRLIEGSSTDLQIFGAVRAVASKYKKIMVVLDSLHTCEHVLAELNIYAGLVSKDCYLLVLDTVIEDLKIDPERPWGPGNSPKTAVLGYMKENPELFTNDKDLESRAVPTVAPNGYWRRV